MGELNPGAGTGVFQITPAPVAASHVSGALVTKAMPVPSGPRNMGQLRRYPSRNSATCGFIVPASPARCFSQSAREAGNGD